MIDTAPSQAARVWVAEQIVRQHRETPDPHRATGRCAQCTDSGCPLLTWAEEMLRVDLVQTAR